ncbi:C40 family peptidase [Cohnella suwonensis]|uniref:C40 family peptidase n=1 Tax=Cohnella suwonensis TaxID=696072 RepID=A0ABW0LU01_9BACL
MKNPLTIKLLLAFGIAATGLFGSMAGHAPKASAATQQSLDLISFGKTFQGTPYQYGATAGVTYAFDCSSFVQYIFGKFGIDLPRTSVSQAYTGEKIDKAYLSVGDLVFFRTNGYSISHVAIYAGGGKILHSSSSQGVTVSNMNTSYWSNAYAFARRVL